MNAPATREPKWNERETLLRQAIRDAVNRNSRKPFFWGGLSGYLQLEAIVQVLHQVPADHPESAYLRSLIPLIERVLAKNRWLAADLKLAHQGLCKIAHCLGYPRQDGPKLTSSQVAQAIETLIAQFQPSGKQQRAQRSLLSALKRRWKRYAQELLCCYNIPRSTSG